MSYFTERGTLIVPALARDVERETRFRVGADGRLYRYEEGVYLPDGEELARARALELLGERVRRSHLNEVVAYFASREGVTPLSLDPDRRDVVRVRNGIVDPRALEVEDYTPENATLVRLPWRYDPAATCPRIDDFLREVLPEDAVGFFYELVGYSALPRNRLRKAVLEQGTGRNGKSIVLSLWSDLLGRGNVTAVPLARLGGDDRFSPARLVGKLANICGDVGARPPRDMSLFKQLTGGDRIYGEHKNRPGFEFECGALPVFSANEFPQSPDTTLAFMERWLVLSFPNQFAEDAKLEAELKALGRDESEMTGFLRRSIEGAGRLIERGDFEVPESSNAAWERYRMSVDAVAAFVAEECEVGPDKRTERRTLFAEYQAYCAANGYKARGKKTFYERVRSMNGIEEYRDREFLGVQPHVVLPASVSSV